MNVLHIAKNIPSPLRDENDIILQVERRLRERYSYHSKIIFPLEYLPRFFGCFIPRSERLKEILFLPNNFTYEGKDIEVIRYLRLPMKSFSNFLTGYFHILPSNTSLLQRLLSVKYDVVHAYHVVPDGAIALHRLVKARLYVLTVRQGDVDKMKSLTPCSYELSRYYNVIKSFDTVVVHNHSISNFLRDKLGISAVVIPHANESIRSSKVNSTDSNIIMCSSRLISRKNVDWVIKAFQSYKSLDNTDYRLVITGDGPEMSSLKSISGERVSFLGAIDVEDNMKLMTQSCLFLLPSQSETFGRVYVEALSAGTPIIALKDTGLDGYEVGNAITFASDYDSFQRELHSLLESKSELRSRSEAAYEAFENNFTWERVLASYNDVYKGSLTT